MSKKTVALIIMDGFGNRADQDGNAIIKSGTPNINKLKREYPTTELHASGREVGLPTGQMGNSEVGHLNIGAGRVVYQDITRIDKAIEDGSFFSNEALCDSMQNCLKNNSALHIMGLLSNGGVHSSIEHLFALLNMAKQKNIKKLFVHCFLDGRDTPPKSAIDFLQQLEKQLSHLGIGKIVTIIGRYYAMDRDKRFERVELAYNAIMYGQNAVSKKMQLSDMQVNHNVKGAIDAIENSYSHGINDEFVVPTVIKDYEGVKNNDSIIFYNFRSDRARQITTSICDSNFDFFACAKIKTNFVCFTQYDANIKGVKIAFEPKELKNTLGEFLSKNNLKQVRIAETEKYAHVTFFFNGGIEAPFNNEDRILVASPKVATYDLKPQMSADEVCQKAVEVVGKYDVIILNFANCDMVGHTGFLDATIQAVNKVDECVNKLITKILKVDGQAIITADHGNAEQMTYPDGSACTTHTTDLVPCILVSKKYKNNKLKEGKSLEDIAPTILQLLDLKKPLEMTGESLILS